MNTTQRVSNNFGKRGWLVVILFGVMLFLASALTADGTNIIIPTLAEKLSLDQNAMLATVGIAGWIATVAAFILAFLSQKFGPKKVIVVSLAITSVSYLGYAFIQGMAGWYVCTILINIFSYGISFCGYSAVIANWFPLKKGMVMGWATIGNNMASAVFIPIFALLLGRGVNMPFYGYFIFMVIMLVLILIIVKNTPEEAGLLPDNEEVSVEIVKAMQEEMANYKSPWTLKRILSDKDTWCAGIGYGLLFLCTIGLVVQFVNRALMFGFEQTQATLLLTVAALIGVAASLLWGVLDTKKGTKFASICLSIWFAAALFLFAMPFKGAFLVGVVLTGCALGGNTNFSTSMCASLFGRKNFQRAFNFMFPLCGIFKSAGPMLLAVILAKTGKIEVAYIIFAVGAVIAAILFGCINMTPKEEYRNDG